MSLILPCHIFSEIAPETDSVFGREQHSRWSSQEGLAQVLARLEGLT
jgi:hypothetical protein